MGSAAELVEEGNLKGVFPGGREAPISDEKGIYSPLRSSGYRNVGAWDPPLIAITTGWFLAIAFELASSTELTSHWGPSRGTRNVIL